MLDRIKKVVQNPAQCLEKTRFLPHSRRPDAAVWLTPAGAAEWSFRPQTVFRVSGKRIDLLAKTAGAKAIGRRQTDLPESIAGARTGR
ncbi:hypothetical protein [Rhodocyclus tenuis]|uniref:hypothetical protein n=1 Tax=Rhodocyclus tenuis TaxID=1066 RepID=UPI00190658A6|nr:hypothetical protein [Rhodocyclus tenuis]